MRCPIKTVPQSSSMVVQNSQIRLKDHEGCHMDFVTKLFLRFNAQLVGSDAFGNRYYEERKARPGKAARRYVRYNGMVEASKVPADWHGWLHHTEQSPPPADGYAKHSWQQDHMPNTTGTTHAHRPSGHVLSGGSARQQLVTMSRGAPTKFRGQSFDIAKPQGKERPPCNATRLRQ